MKRKQRQKEKGERFDWLGKEKGVQNANSKCGQKEYGPNFQKLQFSPPTFKILKLHHKTFQNFSIGSKGILGDLHYLYGEECKIFTDHQCLKYIFMQKEL